MMMIFIFGYSLAHRQRQRDAVHDRHVDVGQEQIELALLQVLKRLRAVVGHRDFVAALLQPPGDEFPERQLILRDQDFGHQKYPRITVGAE